MDNNNAFFGDAEPTSIPPPPYDPSRSQERLVDRKGEFALDTESIGPRFSTDEKGRPSEFPMDRKERDWDTASIDSGYPSSEKDLPIERPTARRETFEWERSSVRSSYDSDPGYESDSERASASWRAAAYPAEERPREATFRHHIAKIGERFLDKQVQRDAGDRRLLESYMRKYGYDPHPETQRALRELAAGTQGQTLTRIANEDPQKVYAMANALADYDQHQNDKIRFKQAPIFYETQGLAIRGNLHAVCNEMQKRESKGLSPLPENIDYGQARQGEKKKYQRVRILDDFRGFFDSDHKLKQDSKYLTNFLANHGQPVPEKTEDLLRFSKAPNSPAFQSLDVDRLSDLKALAKGIEGYNVANSGRAVGRKWLKGMSARNILGGPEGKILRNLNTKIQQLEAKQEKIERDGVRAEQLEQIKKASEPAAIANSFESFVQEHYKQHFGDHAQERADKLVKAARVGMYLEKPPADFALDSSERKELGGLIEKYQTHVFHQQNQGKADIAGFSHEQMEKIDQRWGVGAAQALTQNGQNSQSQSNAAQPVQSEMGFSPSAIFDANGNPFKDHRNPEQSMKHNWSHMDEMAAHRNNKELYGSRYDVSFNAEKKTATYTRDGVVRFEDNGGSIKVHSNDVDTLTDVLKSVKERNHNKPLDFSSIHGSDDFKENVLKASVRLGYPVQNVSEHMKATYQKIKDDHDSGLGGSGGMRGHGGLGGHASGGRGGR